MRVAIAGYGVEGEQNAKYWLDQGDEVVVLDEKEAPNKNIPSNLQTILGAGALDDLSSYDMVVRGAGVAPRKLATAKLVWSATNEFFAKCEAPIIGVTGTKGKGTTSSLIASILRAAGKTVHLVGNIGIPALEVLPVIKPDDVVVYELSSFQLWDLKMSPHVAVVLMIEQDHQDVHVSMDEYVNAKSNIRRHQSLEDICIYHPTNEYSRRIATSSELPESGDERRQWLEQAFRYAVADDGQVYADGGNFCIRGEIICSVGDLRIVGPHNIENACAAISAALKFSYDFEAVSKGLSMFTGLPHRLRFVGEVGGVKYYDDSIATTPGSAIAALDSFDGDKVIILGGSDKGADYVTIVNKCKEVGARVVAIGQTGEKITSLCREGGVKCVRELGTMDRVVPIAARLANGRGVVILSPASASFDQYKSYADRGDRFVAAVENLS